MDLNMMQTLAEGAAPNLFPVPSVVFWTMLNFAILLAVLYKFLYKPLLGAISAREQEIENSLRKTAEDLAEAERLRRDFEAQLSNAQREANEIISKATKAGTAVKEEIESEARTRATELLENATKTIEREKTRALAELREEVANLAIMVAGKVIEKNLDNDDQKRLADRFVAEVGEH